MNDRGWLPTRADGEIWVGRGVAPGASGRGRVYAHTVLLEQRSNGTRVCVWPRPHPGFSLSTDIWQERTLPPPHGLDAVLAAAGSTSAHVHRAPLKHRRKREELCRQDAPPGATIRSYQRISTTQSPSHRYKSLQQRTCFPTRQTFHSGMTHPQPGVSSEKVLLYWVYFLTTEIADANTKHSLPT